MRPMNYELYMRAALAEAAGRRGRASAPDGAVAVLDEAMVAHGRDAVARAAAIPPRTRSSSRIREAATPPGRAARWPA